MFEFMGMLDNYEDRKVDRYEEGDMAISTCSVTDSPQPYETAIMHPEYNGGEHIIVEQYDTAELAQEGHDKWVKVMTATSLPKLLKDISTCGMATFAKAFADKDAYTYNRIIK